MNRASLLRSAIILLVSGPLLFPRGAACQPPRLSVIASESLVQTPITLSVDEQTIGELLSQLLSSVAAIEGTRRGQQRPIRSLWFAPGVDTEARVSLAEAQTPAAQLFLKVAQSKDLAVFPLPGVLVVGPPEWIDAMLSHLHTNEQANRDSISIRWPTGSTAAEILALILAAPSDEAAGGPVTNWAELESLQAAGKRAGRIPTWVPHDIWSAGSLIGVDRNLAVGLLLAQFRCGLRPGTPLASLTGKQSTQPDTDPLDGRSDTPAGVLPWEAMPAAKPFLLAYPAGDSALPIRTALAKVRPRPSIRVSDNRLLINTFASHHLRLVAVHWKAATEKAARAAVAKNGTPAVFDLQLIDTPASSVLSQLAQAAGKKFRLDPEAEAAGETLVSLDETKKTLEELAELVAASVGLDLSWGEAEVVVTNP
ncbi:hypothetical protein [Allorhodopirellula solitaria]|uniref:Uncharacterized protein n=1 Tax=Allorhodopirellula solitaria TaxID=2527987 RepID=A0A5C5XNF3_9BACT|nr:hypothetical protein [Allorhodopirellula solitaria]TWT64726.1 hypothetical protein CA85_35110 [Allorhodopirellula solitaria]